MKYLRITFLLLFGVLISSCHREEIIQYQNTITSDRFDDNPCLSSDEGPIMGGCCNINIDVFNPLNPDPGAQCNVTFLFLDQQGNQYSETILVPDQIGVTTVISLPKNECYSAWVLDIGSGTCGDYSFRFQAGSSEGECFIWEEFVDDRGDAFSEEFPEFSFCLDEDCEIASDSGLIVCNIPTTPTVPPIDLANICFDSEVSNCYDFGVSPCVTGVFAESSDPKLSVSIDGTKLCLSSIHPNSTSAILTIQLLGACGNGSVEHWDININDPVFCNN